jgi:hypothetical protein
MDWRVVDALELGVADVALGSIGGSGRPELEEGSKAGGYGKGHAIGIVNGNAFQVFALAETIHQALQTFVRQRPVKLWLDAFLQAFPENLGPAGKIVAQDAPLRAGLVGRE